LVIIEADACNRSQPSGAQNQANTLQTEGVVVTTGALGELTVSFGKLFQQFVCLFAARQRLMRRQTSTVGFLDGYLLRKKRAVGLVKMMRAVVKRIS